MSSIFKPGRNCFKTARAERAAFLVDAEDYFKIFAQVAERAVHSIIILAWDFDSRTQVCGGTDETQSVTLGPFLNQLVKRRRGLHIYVLDWDYPMVFGTDREFPPLYGLGWKPRRRVHLKYDNTHPVTGSHHQKIVVIDDAIAFSGGLDLTSRRWDTCEHRADDPRRIANGTPYPPFHDLMALVDGTAAQVLADVARERWKYATGETIPRVAAQRDPWPSQLRADLTDVEVGISRTIPPLATQPAVREVEALYLDMIARARRYIHIENQYLTAYQLGAALAQRLAEPDGPEIVIVLRLLSHGWLEEATMHTLRARLIASLRAADRWQRLGVYYAHVPGLKEGTCVDVHSKMIAVDDEWLRIGSANFSNRSMGVDTECDLTFEACGEARIVEVIRGFRNRLLAEHLGVAPDRVQAEYTRTGSLNGAISALQSDARTLKPLEKLPEWSEAVVSVAALADPEQPASLERLIKEFAPPMDEGGSRPAWGVFIAIAVISGVMAAAWKFTPLAELLTAERVLGWAHDFAHSAWGPIIVLVAYTPACIVMFPRPLITLLAVMAFGAWLGFAYAAGGILIAALSTYAAGRMLDRATVRRLAGTKLNQVSEVLRQRGLLAMTAVRLVPIAPFAVIGMVAGAIRIKLGDFMLGTALGLLPGTVATTIFGDQLEAALRDPAQINYWPAAAIILLLGGGVFVVRRWLYLQIKHPGAPGKDSAAARSRANDRAKAGSAYSSANLPSIRRR